LLKNCVAGGDFYREPTEDVFKDLRIGWVRESVESTVFEYFMRNYMRALRHCHLLREKGQQTDKTTVLVYNKQTQTVHSVS